MLTIKGKRAFDYSLGVWVAFRSTIFHYDYWKVGVQVLRFLYTSRA